MPNTHHALPDKLEYVSSHEMIRIFPALRGFEVSDFDFARHKANGEFCRVNPLNGQRLALKNFELSPHGQFQRIVSSANIDGVKWLETSTWNQRLVMRERGKTLATTINVFLVLAPVSFIVMMYSYGMNASPLGALLGLFGSAIFGLSLFASFSQRMNNTYRYSQANHAWVGNLIFDDYNLGAQPLRPKTGGYGDNIEDDNRTTAVPMTESNADLFRDPND